MPSPRSLLAAALLLAGCASPPSPAPPPGDVVAALGAQAAAEVGAREISRLRLPCLGTLVGYLPNRVLDLFDVVRCGVNLGPGLGVQVKATDPLQVTAMSRTSLGVGLQSLRHLPVTAGRETTMDGPVAGPDADEGLDWHRSPTDVRVEVHALVAGAHAAVDPWEAVDFALGFVGIDLRGDDRW